MKALVEIQNHSLALNEALAMLNNFAEGKVIKKDNILWLTISMNHNYCHG